MTIQQMAKDYGVTWKTARSWLRREAGLCIDCATVSETRLCRACHEKWFPAWKACLKRRTERMRAVQP